MAKKLDEATKLLIDSLPENLQKLATSAVDVGYLSKIDFDDATDADEVPADEKEEVLDFFQQDLGLEILETDNYAQNMDKYYDDDSDEPMTNRLTSTMMIMNIMQSSWNAARPVTWYWVFRILFSRI